MRRRVVALTLAAALAVSACSRGERSAPASTPPTTLTPPTVVVNGEQPVTTPTTPGLVLSEGNPDAIRTDLVRVVEGDPLSDDEFDEVLDRLPEWTTPDDTDSEDFNRPAERLGPPVADTTVDAPFPPATTVPPPDTPDPVDPATTPLHVVRYQPDGEVAVAPFLSVTFDQPMVALQTVDQLATVDVPVQISPAVEGRWRWIGTRTARFEVVPCDAPAASAADCVDRLPGATEYTVTVPAGTTAANGAVLAEAVTFTFATPPPSVTNFIGTSESMAVDPVFVAVFDQVVDPAAVLPTIRLTAGGDDVAVRAATDAEVAADDTARTAAEAALGGRAVAFVATAALPGNADVTVEVGPGTPSAEGLRTSTEPATYRGRTHGPLTLRRHYCEYPDRATACAPGQNMSAEFTNELATAALTQAQVAELVSVEPAIPGMRISVWGNLIEIGGATAGSTTYTVTFAAELADVWGQTLGEPVSVEFSFGHAEPYLRGFDRRFVTVDPMAATPAVSVHTVNHDSVHVTAWAVGPDQLDAFARYQEQVWSDTRPPEPDWPMVLDTDVTIDADTDVPTETLVDLSAAFADGGTQLVVRIASNLDLDRNDNRWWQNQPTVAWVQQTTLGIDAFADSQRLVIWSTDLATGDPVPGVTVDLLGRGDSVTTDAQGLATIELTEAMIHGLWATDATNAGRTALLTQGWWGGWQVSERGDEGRWFVFDDRGLYKPGETARVAGWVRHLDWSADAQLALYEGDVTLAWQASDGYGNEIATGTTALNGLGGFNLDVAIPEGANLGYGWLNLQLSGPGVDPRWGAGWSHQMRIEEYRRPEFEVSARAVSSPPHFVADGSTVAVDATYYAGGPLANAEVNWLVGTSSATYAPPGWDDYHFGVYTPWWWAVDFAYGSECWGCGPGATTAYEQFAGRTDADGTHLLGIAFGSEPDEYGTEPPAPDLPRTVTAEATVYDVNRQAWTATTDLLVHPARAYVGVRSTRSFVEAGTPLVVEAVVTDVDGAVAAGRPVTVTISRVDWVWSQGTTSEQLTEVARCELTSGDAELECSATPDLGGQYRVTAVVTDSDGNPSRSELTVWVAGGTGRPSRGVEQQQVTIVPATDEFAPGDTAELLVQAPFAPASGVYTVSHGTLREAFAFDAPDGSAVLRIPITDADVPDLVIDVEMVGTTPRLNDDGTPAEGAPDRPAYAVGRIDLPVPPVSRTLTVTATPADSAIEPGAATDVTVAVTGPDGEPVAGADVALVVVDEAVLALTGYQLADPLGVFYRTLDTWLQGTYGRASIVLTRADLAAGGHDGDDSAEGAPAATMATAMPTEDAAYDMAAGGDIGALGGKMRAAESSTAGEPIEVRDDFDAVAVFEPGLATGADGTVTFPFDLPDSLTRYRVMAVAVDGVTDFGKGEAAITARLPLMVRPSAPRFANFGDRFELPVVLQNLTDAELVVDVAVETTNLDLTGPAGKRVTVPANDRIEVRFPVATANAGTARYRVVAAAIEGTFVDAVEGALPVYTPATAEAFATYGVLDGTAAAGVPVVAPTDVFAQFGGLEITTSSTAVARLTDAVLYITDYPYESADSLAARIIAIATLRDVLEAFAADGLPSPAELDAAVARDLAKLVALRNDDGGWAWWQRGRPSDPWVSVTAAHSLVLAQQQGYGVGQADVDTALGFLANIEQYIPDYWGPEARAAVRSYAVYVRGEAGQADAAKALTVYRESGDALQLDGMAWLWPSITDTGVRAEIERTFLNRATDTAGAASFATDYGESAYLVAHSDRRTDAIVLDGLLTQTPDSELVPKVVAGLMAGQTRGRWANVYENAFALVALHRYFATFESVTPDFVARAWLGDEYVAEHEFAGRSTDRSRSVVPMQELLDTANETGTPLTIAADGEGRLYYRLGLRYAPASLDLAARDEGFVVDRVYEAVDDPGDVWRDYDGTWHVKAGAQVRVRLTMVADAVRTHVGLVDPLPAGLEARNPALATTGTILPDDSGSGADEVIPYWGRSWWWGHWWEHENLGDDRVEVIAGWIDGGTYEYSYIARATTPGEFVVPPTRAEEIYAPETFGRTATDRLVVVDG